MVLDFCPGGDLALHLAQKGKFDENEAKFYVAELLVAIDHLHSMNVLYRDLKPENILIGEISCVGVSSNNFIEFR